MDQNHNESKINRNGCHDRYSMKNFNKKGIQCYNCQKWGHFGDECRSKRLQDKKKWGTQLAHDENFDLEHVLLMVTTKSKGDFFDLCYLDTGCSNHMSGRKEWFIKSKVKFGGNSVVIARVLASKTDKNIVSFKRRCKRERRSSLWWNCNHSWWTWIWWLSN